MVKLTRFATLIFLVIFKCFGHVGQDDKEEKSTICSFYAMEILFNLILRTTPHLKLNSFSNLLTDCKKFIEHQVALILYFHFCFIFLIFYKERATVTSQLT